MWLSKLFVFAGFWLLFKNTKYIDSVAALPHGMIVNLIMHQTAKKYTKSPGVSLHLSCHLCSCNFLKSCCTKKASPYAFQQWILSHLWIFKKLQLKILSCHLRRKRMGKNQLDITREIKAPIIQHHHHCKQFWCVSFQFTLYLHAYIYTMPISYYL